MSILTALRAGPAALACAAVAIGVVGPAVSAGPMAPPASLAGVRGPVSASQAITGPPGQVVGPPAAAPRWRSPVGPPVVVMAGYRPPAQRWLAGHRGVDLRTSPGAEVRAAGAGRVVHARDLAGRPVISIDHGGLRTTYEPVTALVVVGQEVGRGQIIGRMATGSGHCGHGGCLHFGVRRGREYLNPMFLLAGYRAVLRS